MIELKPCPKAYTLDQDKAASPADTVGKVKSVLADLEVDILSETRRVDNGRLGIPVFLSVAGAQARQFMPTRKQMGKGVSPEQAEASAVMELMERYGFFTFWERRPKAFIGSWSEAEAKFGRDLLPLEEILRSVGDDGSAGQALQALDLLRWMFFPVLHISSGRTFYAPVDWFKKLSEFNGSSAGNTDVESIFQGACELVERHVCCLAERDRLTLPNIDQASIKDEVLAELLAKFTGKGIRVLLKDFSLGMPVPTVAALAYDPATFPDTSEIVFTAGTAASPAKAAIRALTEVAQLAGDFDSGACYEASGLPKYSVLEETAWLERGDSVNLDTLPSIESGDILDELKTLSGELAAQGFNLYSIATTNPFTLVPTHYSFVPGFQFRERDKNASVGLFVGRILAEDSPDEIAGPGLKALAEIYPGAHYHKFFQGILAMQAGNMPEAVKLFGEAEPVQPDDDSKGLAAFYAAYCMTQQEDYAAALPYLDRAVNYCPEMKEYFNLRGVCRYKLEDYSGAARDFEYIIRRLDKGSAMDLANLGVCLKYLGRKEEALKYLLAALSIEPGLEFVHNHLEELAGGK